MAFTSKGQQPQMQRSETLQSHFMERTTRRYMKKIAILSLLLLTLGCGPAQMGYPSVSDAQTIYARPVYDVDGGSSTSSYCYNTSYTYVSSGLPSSWQAVYVGKSGVGPVTSPSVNVYLASNTWYVRNFTFGGSYTTYPTIVYVTGQNNLSSGGAGGYAQYSTDSGVTWTLMGQFLINTQSTFTATVPTGSYPPMVSVCDEEASGTGGGLTIYDIWSAGAPVSTGQDGGTFTTEP
jgi:hypothetical protein